MEHALGGGGYFEGKGIVIGEGNSLVGDDAEWASNIVIGCNACVGIDGGDYSSDNIAIGNGAKAINGYSTALGHSAKASGASSTALGSYACASGQSSMAWGTYANASCGDSIALGNNTSALGASSTALGSYACASGSFSTALGAGASASGCVSTAVGYYTIATGHGALAMGYRSAAVENEIVLRSENSTSTACNVLKVSSTGVLTLNGKEVGNTCVYAEVATKFSAVEGITTTDNDYSLSDIATKLNEILNLLKNETTA